MFIQTYVNESMQSIKAVWNLLFLFSVDPHRLFLARRYRALLTALSLGVCEPVQLQEQLRQFMCCCHVALSW